MLVAVLAGGAQAASFEKSIWGPVSTPIGKSAFPIYHDLGVDTFQIQLQWNVAAPTRPKHPTDPRDPAYRWPAELRTALTQARRYGIRVAFMVKGTPPWASPHKKVTSPPTRAADLANFFTAAVKHYPAVRRWMVWGEVARLANWSPIPAHQPDVPRRYARLLDASYAAIKKADPHAIVIGGMTFTAGEVYPTEFLRWLRLPNGRPPRMDWWGHNPYTYREPDIMRPDLGVDLRDINDIDTFAGEIAKVYRGANMRVPRLWLSEYSISSDRSNRGFSYYVSRPLQATYVTEAYALARQQKVAGLGWYGLFDEPASVPDGWTFGLMDADGTPKPAYAAYRAVRSAPPSGR